jgi:hypothetical protein
METTEQIEDLIYDLVFSRNQEYKIDVSEYIYDIYEYDIFIKSIKEILKKSKVSIINSNINLNSKTVIWELKVKR